MGEKDIIYLERGKEKFLLYLAKINKNFSYEVNRVFSNLMDRKIKTFVTDRDGTINNYAERYRSSIQSVYNAIFLNHFILKISGK